MTSLRGLAGPVLVVLDGSRAGQAVLTRGRELALQRGVDLHVISLGARLATTPESLPLAGEGDVCPHDRALLDALPNVRVQLHPVPLNRSPGGAIRSLADLIGATHVVFPTGDRPWSRDRLNLMTTFAGQPLTLCPTPPTGVHR